MRAGRGTVGKTAIVGAKDRKTNKVKAKVVKATDAKTLQGFVIATTLAGATVYSDDAAAYKGMSYCQKLCMGLSCGGAILAFSIDEFDASNDLGELI